MFALSFYRYDLCIYGGSRGGIDVLVRETLRSLASYLLFFTVVFAF